MAAVDPGSRPHELLRERLGHGAHPSSADTHRRRSDVTYPCSRPSRRYAVSPLDSTRLAWERAARSVFKGFDATHPLVDNHPVDLTLQKPDLVDEEAWRAVEQHRSRLATAIAFKDAALIIGSAKELVECVARVATAVGGVITPSNADFAEVVNSAHVALDRQAGKGITRASDVRAIAQHAKKIVLSVKDLRNDFGTGHGRAEVKSIADEMVALVLNGALLWVRWALTRLEHLILRAPENLIVELRGLVTRRSLAEHLEALVLPEQPEEVQHAVGVAFAQRAASGTFVAREVGLDGPASSDDLIAWPVAYRLGVAEGLTLSSSGFLTLEQNWVPMLVDILLPLPPNQVKQFVHELSEKVSTSEPLPNATEDELSDLAGVIEQHTKVLPQAARRKWQELALVVDPSAGV